MSILGCSGVSGTWSIVQGSLELTSNKSVAFSDLHNGASLPRYGTIYADG